MQEGTKFKRLIEEVPDFKPVYEEHVGYYEELLPHVLMGDFARFIIDNYRRATSGGVNSGHHMNVTQKSLGFMERVVSSLGSDLQELVSVSFLENLDQAGEDYEGIKALLGPRLKRELAAYEADA